MRHLRYISLGIVMLAMMNRVSGQTGNAENKVEINIPEVAILDLESSTGTGVSLEIKPPKEAGEMVDLSEAKDSSLWLNYSSITSSGMSANRKVTAKLVAGSVPAGTRLRVKALDYSGSGDGDLGAPQNKNGVILTKRNKTVVKNINSCYTGNGPNNGHQLVYSLELKKNKYNDLKFNQTNTVTVLYTISEN